MTGGKCLDLAGGSSVLWLVRCSFRVAGTRISSYSLMLMSWKNKVNSQPSGTIGPADLATQSVLFLEDIVLIGSSHLDELWGEAIHRCLRALTHVQVDHPGP